MISPCFLSILLDQYLASYQYNHPLWIENFKINFEEDSVKKINLISKNIIVNIENGLSYLNDTNKKEIRNEKTKIFLEE